MSSHLLPLVVVRDHPLLSAEVQLGAVVAWRQPFVVVRRLHQQVKLSAAEHAGEASGALAILLNVVRPGVTYRERTGRSYSDRSFCNNPSCRNKGFSQICASVELNPSTLRAIIYSGAGSTNGSVVGIAESKCLALVSWRAQKAAMYHEWKLRWRQTYCTCSGQHRSDICKPLLM